MDINLHKQATKMPKSLAEIQAAPSRIGNSELARQYGVSDSIIHRWRYRDDVPDRPHTSYNRWSMLTPEQQAVLATSREFLRLGLDGRDTRNPEPSSVALRAASYIQATRGAHTSGVGSSEYGSATPA